MTARLDPAVWCYINFGDGMYRVMDATMLAFDGSQMNISALFTLLMHGALRRAQKNRSEVTFRTAFATGTDTEVRGFVTQVRRPRPRHPDDAPMLDLAIKVAGEGKDTSWSDRPIGRVAPKARSPSSTATCA